MGTISGILFLPSRYATRLLHHDNVGYLSHIQNEL